MHIMNNKIALPLMLVLGASVGTSLAQPQITRQPIDQSVSIGANAAFSVTATSTAPLSYQWYLNGSILTNSTTFITTRPALRLTDAQPNDAGSYFVVVSDDNGSVTSEAATLIVDPTFTRVTSGDLVTRVGSSRAVAWGDSDGDGYLDLYIAHAGINHEGLLYRNAGDATSIELLRIEWPSGTVQEFRELAPRQILTLTEPAHLEMESPGELRIRSWLGQTFQIEASSDLFDWTSVQTVVNESGTLQFAEPDHQLMSPRFYRAVHE
jgi:hypothetical protein